MKDSLPLLRFIEDLLIEEDGQSLSDIQRHIIEELLNGKTYKEIADSYGYDEKHIGDVSRNKIFKVLSKQLGLEEKELNKSNFRWTIEKAVNSQLFALNKNVNYCVYGHKHGQSDAWRRRMEHLCLCIKIMRRPRRPGGGRILTSSYTDVLCNLGKSKCSRIRFR